MTDNQDLLAMTHVGEDPHKYMKSVTPPVDVYKRQDIRDSNLYL